MVTILETPQSLCERARKAAAENRDVAMDPGQVRAMAERWHCDKEKIKYLESLLIRMIKTIREESDVTPLNHLRAPK